MPADAYALPRGFLMGASTAAHQIEGGNTASDWWAFEHASGTRVREPSGDAADSYHRWREDMDLLAGLGFNAYRFSLEWARIEPARGEVSYAALAHYRRMIEGARERGLEPVVTLHHFTSPLWFAKAGGFAAPDATGLFVRYVETVAPILDGLVRHVVTINEPNMAALMQAVRRNPDADYARLLPDEAVAEGLIAAHHASRDVLHRLLPGAGIGWTIANQVYQPAAPGAEDACRAHAWPREDRFIEAARGDDWIGVQSYSRTKVAEDGPLPVPDGAEKTIMGWEYYPDALGEAVRHTAGIAGPSVPIIVTENGIATADDARRIDYTTGALAGLAAAMRDGADVRGYLHWSALDNYEWGSYEPTFGLIAVDRRTFARTPRPSARWLGGLARAGEIPGGA
ncbi:glycoside hydrolase family 1 protein [Actinomadura nitritigenes]|uniref:glycoside hydrolase family 1 protein n=1 Tax=Actinomadura nitritigenes TaxID=134602 RepID=UPI003D911AAB